MTTFGYDPQGRLSTTTYPQGVGGAFVVKNDYDARGNLVAVRNNLGPDIYWQLLQVDGEGRPSVEHFGNGTETTYERFADKGTFKRISTKKGPTTLQNLSYTYDARLNVTGRIDALQTGPLGALGERFTYDELDRLTCSRFDTICTPGVNCVCNQELSYQPDGNIASKSDVGAYAYDPAHPHAVAQAGAGAYLHDAVGNQVDRPEHTVTYTALDLPKTYTTKANAGVTTFGYSGEGTRIRKTTPTSQTTYVGDFERTTFQSSVLRQYRYAVRAGGRVVAVVARSTLIQVDSPVYLHADHLGSTDVVTNGAGAVTERRSYDAFGAKRNPAWGNPLPGAFASKTTFGFTGDEAEDDLVNMRGRIYDAKLGRFLMTDPVVSNPFSSQRWNPYSYVLNNPLRWVDPSGFSEEYSISNPEFVFPDDPLVATGGGMFAFALAMNDGVGGHTYSAGFGDVVGSQDHDADMAPGEFVAPPSTGTSLKDHPSAQIAGGFLAGTAIGMVPFGATGAELLIKGEVLDKGSKPARIGLAVGQIVGGFALTGGGVGMGVAGGGLTVSGVGAPAGVPVLVGSAGLVAGGLANSAVGVRGLVQVLMSSGSGGDKAKWVSPKEKADLDHSSLRDRLRGEQSGYESGRHDQYPSAMRDELRKMADAADKRGDLGEYSQRLREIAETYGKRAGAAHRGGR